MKRNLKAHIRAWYRYGFVTDEVEDFFLLFGRELTTRSLAGVVELTQKWMKGLRPDGVERWEMPKIEGVNKDLLAVLTETLGLHQWITLEKSDAVCDRLVILGAMTESMEHRLRFGIEQGVCYKGLAIVTAARVLIEREQVILRAAGIDPMGKTEADAAKYLLDKHGLEGEVIVAANKPDGKRATTEETILELAKTLPDDGSLILVSHMPFRFRQELTVLRALSVAGSRQRVTMLGAPKLKPISELSATFFDEACRTLYEIGKLPPELIAD